MLRTTDPTRMTALVAGLFYLGTFVFGIPPFFLYGSLLTDPTWVLGGAPDTPVAIGAIFDTLTALTGIGTAVALFSLVKREHEGFALGFVTSRVYEAALLMIGVVSMLAVITLRGSATTAADPSAAVVMTDGLVAVRDATYLLGPGVAPAINAICLGTLMYRTGLVPRILPIVGLIAAPVLLSSTIGTILGVNDGQSLWTGLATIPVFFWELILGLWMTFKGFRAAAPLVIEAKARAGHPAPATPSIAHPAVAKAGAA